MSLQRDTFGIIIVTYVWDEFTCQREVGKLHILHGVQDCFYDIDFGCVVFEFPPFQQIYLRVLVTLDKTTGLNYAHHMLNFGGFFSLDMIMKFMLIKKSTCIKGNREFAN